MSAASTSAGTEMECCREGILTVFTTVDVAALVVQREGIVTVRKAGGAAVEAGAVSSHEGTLGKRSSISSFTLQSSSPAPAPAAAAATAPATASTEGSARRARAGQQAR